nr:MAG TPA: toxin III family protein [Caudoviricetes sp.]
MFACVWYAGGCDWGWCAYFVLWAVGDAVGE